MFRNPPGAGVTLTTPRPGGLCHPPIPPEARARGLRIADAGRQRGGGLGLPLCESLAQAMGASLQLAPGNGRGAAFVLRLPAATPAP